MVKKILTFGLGVAVIAGAVWYFQSNKTSEILLAPNAENQAAELSVASTTESAEARKTARILVATANYNCDGGKTIRAEFYQGEKIEVAAGQMPVPAGSLKLVLNDGRNLELAQTISADGGRYANGDESFVFWDKGGQALILENGAEKDYINCAAESTGQTNNQNESIVGQSNPESIISQPADEDNMADWKTYKSDIYGFEFKYPKEAILRHGMSNPDLIFTIDEIPVPSNPTGMHFRALNVYAWNDIVYQNQYCPEEQGVDEKNFDSNGVIFREKEENEGANYTVGHYYQYSVSHNNRCYVMSFVFSGSKQDVNNIQGLKEPEIFRQIVSTFKFTD